MADERPAKHVTDSQTSSDNYSGVKMTKPRVIVTGFGPFGEHSVNASWEAVQELATHRDLSELTELIIIQIPVSYSAVTSIVPDLWKQYQPDLVIHCGAHGLLAGKNAIQIERLAHSHGYRRPDVEAKTPCLGLCAPDDGEKCITTGLSLNGLDAWMGPEDQCQKEGRLRCQVSDDAGRYLCEFIYYTSLRIDRHATLFIHVPPLSKLFGPKEISLAIKTVICKVLELNYESRVRVPEVACDVAHTATEVEDNYQLPVDLSIVL